MKKSDLLIDLNEMRKHGEFDPVILMTNVGVKFGKSIALPRMNCTVFLDCEYRSTDLPSYVYPYKFDSEQFWG